MLLAEHGTVKGTMHPLVQCTLHSGVAGLSDATYGCAECVMHEFLLPSQALVLFLTCVWSLVINFRLVRIRSALAKGLHTYPDECKSFRAGSVLLLLLLASLFSLSFLFCVFPRTFYVSPLSPPPLLPRSKERADTLAASWPPLSALFLFFMGRSGGRERGGAGIENKRQKESALSVRFLLYPTFALSLLIPLTFIRLPLFLLFTLFLPAFFLS